MLNPRHKMGIDHDTYLKMRQLQKPKARQFQAILFDECQDASPVMLNIVENQSHVTTVYVGDRHQQIYAWRGAINAMDTINATEYSLTHSFRFGACIADVANRMLAHKAESKKIVGNPNVNSTLCVAKPPFTLLCRTNGEIFSQAVKAVKENQSIAVVGGIESLLVVIESAYALFCDDRFNIKAANLQIFNSWLELIEIATLTDDPELKYYQKMVEEYGHRIPKYCAALREKVVPPEKAALVLSSVHKAKGQEWSHVKLANDFSLYDHETGDLNMEELNLVYVACTRAINVLDLSDADQVACLIGMSE